MCNGSNRFTGGKSRFSTGKVTEPGSFFLLVLDMLRYNCWRVETEISSLTLLLETTEEGLELAMFHRVVRVQRGSGRSNGSWYLRIRRGKNPLLGQVYIYEFIEKALRLGKRTVDCRLRFQIDRRALGVVLSCMFESFWS